MKAFFYTLYRRTFRSLRKKGNKESGQSYAVKAHVRRQGSPSWFWPVHRLSPEPGFWVQYSEDDRPPLPVTIPDIL